MSKKFNEPILAYCTQDKLHAFIWRCRLYKVQQVISTWTINGGWWERKPVHRTHTRVSAQGRFSSGVFELYCEGSARKWFLLKVVD